MQPRDNATGDGRRLTATRLRLREYDKMRRYFALRVYTIATVFVALSFVQWLTAVYVAEVHSFYREHHFIVLMAMATTLVGVTVLIYFETIRYWEPWNWVIITILIESITIGFAGAFVSGNSDEFFLPCFGGTAFLFVILTVIGKTLSRDLTVSTIIFSVFTIFFFIFSLMILMSSIVLQISFPFTIYSIFVILAAMMFTMYHAQTIIGGRFVEMRLHDDLLATLMVYMDFVVLFLLIYFSLSLVAGEVVDEK